MNNFSPFKSYFEKGVKSKSPIFFVFWFHDQLKDTNFDNDNCNYILVSHLELNHIGLSYPPETPKQAPAFLIHRDKEVFFDFLMFCVVCKGQCIPYKSPNVSVTLSLIKFTFE